MNTRTVTSLWVGGELPLMSVLCIKSFLDHGHAFQLFTYRNYDNIPAGTLVRDARDILPEEAIFHDSHNSLAPFSDWFRMKFLSQEGGFWVDMDVICLGDELPASPLWFCREWAEVVAVGAMAFPPGHSVPATLCRLAEDPALRVPWDSPEEVRAKEELLRRVPDVADRRRQVPWGFCGPTGMTRALRHCGLFDRAAPSSHMYPVPWTRWRDCYNGNIRLAGPELSNAWCVHLWGEMARREPDAWENMSRNSMAGELLDRHLPGHAWKPAPGPRKKVNILVGICSCTGAANRRKACRETWLSHPQEGVVCRFFLGRRTPLPNEPDVVALWVEDDYRHLPAKGLAFYQYALEHYDFDWLFKCDDDTWLALDRLESLCDGRYDLVGDMSLADRGFPSGGAGYLMSRALVEGIVAHGGRVPAVGAEDVIFGRLARELGARVHATPRLFLSHAPAPHRLNDQVSAHWCSPGRMHGIEALFHDEPVAVYDAVHPHWRDELLFFARGRFMRGAGGCTGRYVLQNGLLTLFWDDWAPEALEKNGSGFSRGPFSLTPAAGSRQLPFPESVS